MRMDRMENLLTSLKLEMVPRLQNKLPPLFQQSEDIAAIAEFYFNQNLGDPSTAWDDSLGKKLQEVVARLTPRAKDEGDDRLIDLIDQSEGGREGVRLRLQQYEYALQRVGWHGGRAHHELRRWADERQPSYRPSTPAELQHEATEPANNTD